jgi:hypothetical protein
MSFGDSLNLGLSDAIQSIKNAAGFIDSARNTISAGSLPWAPQGGTSPSTSRFFVPIQIEPSRWNQLFPYRLVVVDSLNRNAIVGGVGRSGALPGSANFTSEVVGGVEGTTLISFQAIKNNWVFNLPITPQQLSITDQYAINTSATLRGILEEHNGVKFKMINASGTMGVWPARESVTKPPTTPGIVQSLFGGTIEAVGGLIQSVTNVINTATGNHPANKPTTIQPENSTFGSQSTGYYQAMALQQFLEQYAEAKTKPENAGWRLVFDIPKQNQSFVVTPMSYDWQQNAQKPLEIMYKFQLKGWRRIQITNATANALPDISVSPGLLQRVLNTISAARTATSKAIVLIGAVRSDVETPLNVLRQTSLFVKDLAGVAITAADLPSQVARDYSSAIGDFMKTLSLNSLVGSPASDPAVVSSLKSIQTGYASREGLSQASVSGGQIGGAAATAQSIDPSLNVLNKPESNFGLMDQVPLSGLSLTNAQQAVVDDIIEQARQTTIDTLKQYRGTVLQLALQLSNSFGTGNAFYNQVYGLPPPTPRIQPITLDEYDLLQSLYDAVQSYDALTATNQIDDNNKQTNMDYVAGLADQSGIPFTITAGKIMVPVPFGLTIEGIAQRYLGDAQRWIEIATLNNLRDPYIDENGFKLTLLSNATGRQITVNNVDNLYIGQFVLLMSSTQVPSSRIILGIDRLSDTSFLLTLDGLPNLDNFVLADGAYLQAYLPGTVNSQQKIFVPTDLPVPESLNITPPGSTSADPLTGLSKVDWLLDENGDVAVNNFGDFRYSSGITNIIQALKIKLSTQKNKWLLHPEFGLNLSPGNSIADISAQKIYNSINDLVAQDSRFQGIDSLQISVDGPTVSIGMSVLIAGQTGVFPLTFTLTP